MTSAEAEQPSALQEIILFFQEDKFKEQSGRVRQIVEGAITKMRKGQGNKITLPLT